MSSILWFWIDAAVVAMSIISAIFSFWSLVAKERTICALRGTVAAQRSTIEYQKKAIEMQAESIALLERQQRPRHDA